GRLTHSGAYTRNRVNLAEAQAAARRKAAVQKGLRLFRAERAVLVAVEFTGERRKLGAAARAARSAAAQPASPHPGAEQAALESVAARDLDFSASLAEFEELARSAGAEVAATL